MDALSDGDKEEKAIKRVTPTRDEPPTASRSEDLVKYLLVELYVRRENVRDFERRMRELVELMFDYKRWELVLASYPIAGKLNRFVHVWKIPHESDVLEVMRVGAPADDAPEVLRDCATLEQEFRFCYQRVQELIVDTEHQLVTSLPYDPTHVGYQTQTVLFDTQGEIFVIDHGTLRRSSDGNAIKNIAGELEEVRRSEPRVRANTDKGDSEKRRMRCREQEKKEENEEEKERREWLKTIQDHLNRGSTVATIEAGKSRHLLFNLAGLKARSVYQPIDTAELIATTKTKLERATKGNGFPDIAANLLIATPWGDVYEVGPQGLSEIAKRPTNPKEVEAALAPLTNGNTPLAAVPEERDKLIGDGCACYVINLKAFLAAGGLKSAPGQQQAPAAYGERAKGSSGKS